MFSIIIPHKNIYELLVRSINSIPASLDCEIIIVDDNSEKRVKKKIKDLCSINERIYYYETEGRGAGEARNIGIAHAKGDWLIFMDSDDFFTKDAETVLNYYSDSYADIIYFPVTSVYSTSFIPATRHLHKTQNLKRFWNKPDKLERWLRYEYTEPWGKLFRTQFIKTNNIKFAETKVSNDYLFSVRSGHLALQITYDTHSFYCVTVRENSLCNNMFDTQERMLARVEAYKTVEEFFKKNSIALFPCSIFTLKIILKNPRSWRKFYNELFKLGISKKDILLKYPLNCIHMIPKKIFEIFKIPLLGY